MHSVNTDETDEANTETEKKHKILPTPDPTAAGNSETAQPNADHHGLHVATISAWRLQDCMPAWGRIPAAPCTQGHHSQTAILSDQAFQAV